MIWCEFRIIYARYITGIIRCFLCCFMCVWFAPELGSINQVQAHSGYSFQSIFESFYPSFVRFNSRGKRAKYHLLPGPWLSPSPTVLREASYLQQRSQFSLRLRAWSKLRRYARRRSSQPYRISGNSIRGLFAYELFRVYFRRTGKEVGNRKSISSWVRKFPRRDSGTDLG